MQHKNPPTYKELAEAFWMAIAHMPGSVASAYTPLAQNALAYARGLHAARSILHECPQCAGPVPASITPRCSGNREGYGPHAWYKQTGGKPDRCVHCNEARPSEDYKIHWADFSAPTQNLSMETAISQERNKQVPHAARPISIGQKRCLPNACNTVLKYIKGIGAVNSCVTCGYWRQTNSQALRHKQEEALCRGNVKTGEHTYAYYRPGGRGPMYRRCVDCDLEQVQHNKDKWLRVLTVDGDKANGFILISDEHGGLPINEGTLIYKGVENPPVSSGLAEI